jgi:murein DD-endopeptidase MepM/ murein hydrolase activator NlpD
MGFGHAAGHRPHGRRDTTRTRPRRPIVGYMGRALALLVLIAPALGASDTADATPRDALHRERHELHATRARIEARRAKLRVLQGRANRLAERIGRNEEQLGHTLLKIRSTRRQIIPLEQHLRALTARLGERSRQTYVMGPATPMMLLLTAGSAADAARRISLLDEMSRRDLQLVDEIASVRDRLALRRTELQRFMWYLGSVRAELRQDQAALRTAMNASERILGTLRRHRHAVLGRISRIRPFSICPVGDPHADLDNFGVWRSVPKEWGRDHVHEGDDLSAPSGTPIYAPFDGKAVVVNSHAGGLGVSVYGKYGYAYNAHLSRLGALGDVEAGDIVGYVGQTGDATGPHDHFEWHPGDGDAVDPHPYLDLVC